MFICTPNENRTRVTRMKILGTNHYTMGAFNNINTISITSLESINKLYMQSNTLLITIRITAFTFYNIIMFIIQEF